MSLKLIARANGIEKIMEKFKEEAKELLDGYHEMDETNIKEEVVDVMIMCEQIIEHYGFTETSLEDIREFKINRTKERLGIKNE